MLRIKGLTKRYRTGDLARMLPNGELEFMGVYTLAGERVSAIRVCLDPSTLSRQLGT